MLLAKKWSLNYLNKAIGHIWLNAQKNPSNLNNMLKRMAPEIIFVVFKGKR